MGESLDDNNITSPTSLDLSIRTCLEETQISECVPINNSLLTNGHSPELVRKHRGKSYPPPLTAELLKKSRRKLQRPKELVFTSDDDDDDSPAAAANRLVLIIGKKYNQNIKKKWSRAEQAQLHDMENPRPSTSAALVREMNRMRVSNIKSTESTKSQSPSETESINSPIFPKKFLRPKPIRVEPIRKKPVPSQNRVVNSRRKTEKTRKRKPHIEIDESYPKPPESKKIKEQLEPIQPLETELNPLKDNELRTVVVPQNQVIEEEQEKMTEGQQPLTESIELLNLPEPDEQVNASESTENFNLIANLKAIESNQLTEACNELLEITPKKRSRSTPKRLHTPGIPLRVSPRNMREKVSENGTEIVVKTVEIIRRSKRERRAPCDLDDNWIYL